MSVNLQLHVKEQEIKADRIYLCNSVGSGACVKGACIQHLPTPADRSTVCGQLSYR